MSLAKDGDCKWSYLAGMEAAEWGVLGNKVRKARRGHVMEDFECQSEEVKHDAINAAIQEKKNLEISQVSVYKMSLSLLRVCFGTYHIVTIGMSLIPTRLESSEHNRVVV